MEGLSGYHQRQISTAKPFPEKNTAPQENNPHGCDAYSQASGDISGFQKS
jgi:hypothetical protein